MIILFFHFHLHIQGRPCVAEMEKMLHHIDEHNSTLPCSKLKIKISLEIEKYREGIGKLFLCIFPTFLDSLPHKFIFSPIFTFSIFV